MSNITPPSGVYLILDLTVHAHGTTNDHDTPLISVIEAESVERALWLLRCGAPVNAKNLKGHTALHKASFYGFHSIINELLKRGANLEVPTNDSAWTPLHEACYANRVESLRELIQGGANLEAPTRLTQTPLHIACAWGHLDIVEELVNHGANLEALTYHNDQSPLHIASWFGHLNIVMHLLDKGVDIESRGSSSGRTSLYRASCGDHIEIVKELIKRGANVNAATSYGMTPFSISENSEIKSLLKANGANDL